jgi:hypothetical protein
MSHSHKLIIFSIALLCISSFCSAQEPCLTEPFKGYKGDCNITITMSLDGKYIYTSDRVTLKIWEVSTNTIVKEITPFTYDIYGNSNNPRHIRVRGANQYASEGGSYVFDLEKMEIYKPQPLLIDDAKLSDLYKKDALDLYRKSKNADVPEFQYKFYISKDAKLKKIDLRTKKVSSYGSEYDNLHYLPEAKALICAKKIKLQYYLHILNLEKDTWIETDIAYPFIGKVLHAFDSKHVLLFGNYSFIILDITTGNTKASFMGNTSSDEPAKIHFKPDSSGFYLYVMETDLQRKKTSWSSDLMEYSYPQFQLISKTPFHKNIQGGSMFNPATKYFYTKANHYKAPLDLSISDNSSGEFKGNFFIEEKGKFEGNDKFMADKDLRAKVGNNAIEKLYSITPVEPNHSVMRSGKLKIDAHSNNGKVLIREDVSIGATCIVWKFPEGTPEYMYSSSNNPADRIPQNAIKVPAYIRNGFLSPSGNVVGFNTQKGVYIYRGSALIYTSENKVLRDLPEGRALICTVKEGPPNLSSNVPVCSKQELIDLETGNAIPTIPIDSYMGMNEIGTKLFLSFSTTPPVLKALDITKPKELITLTGGQIEESGFSVYRGELNSAYRGNLLTGKREVIANYRVPNTLANDGSQVKMQGNFLLAFEPNNGFNIVDISLGKSIAGVPLYSGWWNFDDMVYLKNIKKIVAVYKVPIFSSPAATVDDPGASAFSIDIESGEITPYLVTEDRKTYLELHKAAAAAAAYRYSPAGKCEARNNQYQKGSTLYTKGGNLFGIVLGYDCDEEAYVIANREVYDEKDNIYLLRLTKKTFEELNDSYQQSGASHHICPMCNGNPVELNTRTQSGWSDWEQKSLNIYVYQRKWETKTQVVRTVCKQCKGAVLIK